MEEEIISENFYYPEACAPSDTQNKELQIIPSGFSALHNLLIQSHIHQVDISIHSFIHS